MSSRRKKTGGGTLVSPARATAFRVLRELARDRGQPAALLESFCGPELSRADRDLAMEIVYGVLRWQARLDYALAALAKRDLAAIDTPLVLSLRIGLYQLRYLTRVPAHAAVDESVRLARAFGASRGAGFVNAVLRGALRRPDYPPIPSREADVSRYIEVSASHPAWLVRRYVARDGPGAAEKRCAIQNDPPPVYVRVTDALTLDAARRALAEEGVETESVPTAPRCLRLSSGRFHGSRLQRQGLALVQDLGSQLIPHLLDPSEGVAILDVCSAPGGKTSLLASLARGGSVIAVELRPSRARLVRSLSTRLGISNIRAIVADGRRLPFGTPARFMRILLDVPCSSLGTLRRNPDIKWRADEKDLAGFARLQLELLRSVAERLEVGGRLVYATCSTEPEENEHVVESFLEERSDFARVDVRPDFLPEAQHLLKDDGTFQTLPERDDTDGYFAVALTR